MLCRLCIYECSEEDAIAIFNINQESYLSKLILKHLYLEILQDDAFSTKICETCWRCLKEFNEFFETIEKRQIELEKEFLEIKKYETKPTVDKTKESFENNEETLMDIKDVLTDDLEQKDFDFTDCDERNHSANISCNAFNQNEEDQLFDLKNTTSSINMKIKIESSKKGKSNLKVNRKRGRPCKSEKNVLKHKTKVSNEKPKKQAKNILSPEEEKKRDELVAKYVPLKCEVCKEHTSATYKQFQTHFQREHNQKAFVTCCGKRLNKRSLILDHVLFHVNPEHFKCKICSKVLKTRVSLIGHNKIYHKDRAQLKHVCGSCGKQFAYQHKLKKHMAVHSDERNHICEICQKGFKSNFALKWHINHMHGEKTIHICDACGKEYRSKQSFERHVAEHQGTFEESRKQCPICNIWVVFNYLKRHIQRHEKVSVNCDVCGQTLESLPALTTHKERNHRTRKIYSCHFCDKTFERSQYLKEHVDLHTGHKEYSCKYCTRQFRSKANMYAHAKKAHYEEWAQAQLIRSQGPNKTKTAMENLNETKNQNK